MQRRGSWFRAGVRLPDFQVHGHTPLTTGVVLDRYRGTALGLNRLCLPGPTLCSDCFLIIASVVWEEESGLRAGSDRPCPLRTHSDLTFAVHHGPDLLPSCRFTLSPCPECDFQPQTSAPVDCWSCVYSLVGFLFVNVGWGKYSDLSLQRGGACSIIGANCLCG